MYQLTCPSCTSSLSSPFVRSGAVIRCAQCEHKYRIKSSHLTRNLTTGPKTLDELDPLLRGDSVDLDPEVAQAPVRIDEDGNVVGLSGLSELMRKSDADIARTDAVARANAAAHVAPPEARVTRQATAEPAPAAPIRNAQARADARRRRSRMNLIIAAAAVCVVLVLGVTLYSVIAGGDNEPVIQDPKGSGADDSLIAGSPNGNSQHTTDPTDPPPIDPELFVGDGRTFELNDDYQYDPTAVPRRVSVGLPADVTTLLTPSVELLHEGWYILNPPRGSVEATGGEAIELIDLDVIDERDGVVTLQGKVVHHGDEILIAGEAHVALIDPVGRVFAETYLPIGILLPGQSRSVQLEIEQRYWDRSSGVRATVSVLDTARVLQDMPNMVIRPLGHGSSSSLRISTPNPNHPLNAQTLAPEVNRIGRDWVGDFRISIWADDPTGTTIARFRVKLDSFYLPAGQWLDLVIHTPVDADAPKLDWHAIIEAR